MRIQCQRALLFITCFCCTSILQTLSAQTVETAIRAVGNRYPLSKPVQLALSPSGTKFAVADQYGNRIYIMNTDGDLLWLIGSEIKLDLPTAVCFEQEDAILFSLQGKPEILRSFEKFPERIDTLATLSGKLKPFKGIDRLWKTRGNGFLLIDKSRNDVLAFDKDWNSQGAIVKQGHGKGKVWSPVSLALDMAGKILVTDLSDYPLQVFSAKGDFLFYAGWNSPGRERNWEASAVTLDHNNMIWVADCTNRQWRLFDLSGNEIDKRPFDETLRHPLDMVSTSDNKLIVLDQTGVIIIYDLP